MSTTPRGAAWSAKRVFQYLPVLLRGRPLRGHERYRPFFVVGSGRCGTTLLRAVLEAHPEVHIPPEKALRSVVRDYRRYSRLPWNVVLRIVLGQFEFHRSWETWDLTLGPLFHELQALPREARNLAALIDALYRTHAAKHKPSAKRWGDKTPANVFTLPALHAVFPDLRVIHMVRDGRDVALSFTHVAQGELMRSARAWLRAVRAGHTFGVRYPGTYLEVRYEDLVREPATTIRHVAAFLDLAFDARMLRHHELDLPLGELMPSLRDARGPIHQDAVGRWRTAFDSSQRAVLERLLGPTLAQLGYRDPVPK